MASKFKYEKREASSAKRRTEQWGNDRDGYLSDHVSQFRPGDGENVIRILPPSWSGADHYGLNIFVHYGVGPDNSSYLDLSKMGKGPDPIAEAVKQARAEGDEEYAKKIDSKKRVLVYLIDREKPKEGVKMWAMPWTVDKEIAIQCWDSQSQEALPIDSPEDGYDVIITKTGNKERTEYSVKIARRSTQLDITAEIEDVLINHPLPDCLRFYEYDHIKRAFDGGAPVITDKSAKPGREATRSRKAKFDLKSISYEDIQVLRSDDLDELASQVDSELKTSISDKFYESDIELANAICATLDLKSVKTARVTRKAEPEPEPARPTTRPAHKPEPEPEDDDVPFDEEDSESEPEPEPEPETPKRQSYKDRLANLRK